MEFDEPQPDLLTPTDDGDPVGAARDTAGGAPGMPGHLSPSAASTFEQCPRRWRFRYLDRLPDPPGAAALTGTFAHRVLELLLQEEPAGRTVDRARVIARSAWPEMEADQHYAALRLDEAGARAFRWAAWRAVEGLWSLENPADVVVRATEHRVEATVGTVPFRGVIDRLEDEPGGLAVSDYKSGRAPTPRFATERLSQVLLYAAAVEEALGERPARVRLLYLGQKTVEAEVTDELLGTAVASLEDTWASVTAAVAADEFGPRPGPLCAWCPFAAHCPEGTEEIARREAAALAAFPPLLAPVA